jgi:hypothetical protein
MAKSKRPHTDTSIPYIPADPQDIIAALLRTPPPREDVQKQGDEEKSAETEATVTVRTRTVALLAALFAALITIAGYVARRPSCESDSLATKGDVRREVDGGFRYFDGQCWTAKPMPPRDTPF